MHTPFTHRALRSLALAVWLYAPSFLLGGDSLSNLPADQSPESLKFQDLDVFGSLTVGRIHAITQGPDDFMWIGTRQGAYRYDGYRIRSFLHDKLDASSIADDNIWSLHLDHKNRLWIGTQRGLSRFLPETETFKNYLTGGQWRDQRASNQVNAILHTPAGDVLFSTEAGIIYRYREESDSVEPVNEKPLGMIKSMKQDRQGRLLVGVDNALLRYDLHSGKVDRFEGDFRSVDGVSLNYVNSICVLDDQEIWAGTSNRGVIVLNPQTGETAPQPFTAQREEFVNHICADPEGRVWVASNAGLSIYHRGADTVTRLTYEPDEKHTLPISGINAFWADTQGNLWIGSNYDGISISANAKSFETVPLHNRNPYVEPNAPVSAFLEDADGNLWVGDAKSGVAVYPPDDRPARVFRHHPDDPSSLSNQPVLAIFQDSRRDIWLGTYRGGMYKYLPETQSFKRYQHDPDDAQSISGHDIRGFAEDDQGQLWIVTHGTGIDRMDTKSETFVNFRAEPEGDEIGIVNDWVNAIVIDHQQSIWLGTPTGLTVIDPDLKRSRHYQADPDNANALSNSFVNDVFQDSQRRIWIATNDGLNRYLPEQDRFESYHEADGFPHQNISSIIEDDSGYLWTGTYDGIARFDPELKQAKSYTKGDGVVSNDFFEASAIKGADGYLYFGQNRGLTRFLPEAIKDNRRVPKVFITNLHVYDARLPIVPAANKPGVLQASILHTEKVTLTHAQNALNLNFIALNYINPQHNQYSYKLEGFDDDWSAASLRREAAYTNLDPGEYTFRVRASNNDGYWNEAGDALAITILPPFWGTFWFRSLAAFLAVSIPSFLVFWRLRASETQRRQLEGAVRERTADLTHAHQELESAYSQILAHREVLETTVRERTKELEVAKSKAERSDKLKSAFLANMSHEIRTPMNAIIGFLHILDDKKVTPEDREQYNRIIHQSSKSLLGLIDDILDLSAIEAGEAEIRAEPCDLRELCREIEAMFSEALAKEEGKDVSLVVEDRLPPCLPREEPQVEIDPLRLKQVLWNLISNAIKFTDDGEIRLVYRIVEDDAPASPKRLEFTVQDSGIGIPREDLPQIFNRFHKLDRHGKKLYRGAGLGLTITRTLTELMGGNISVESTVGLGTTFVVSLPYRPAKLETTNRIPALPDENKLLAPDFRGCRILVVEDEIPNFEYIEKVLLQTSATIVWAATGTQALDRFKANKFDLVLLDLKVPEIDGYEIAREIRKRDPQIPIVAQSALAMRGDAAKSLAAGANEHLAKPYRPAQLLSSLARYLTPVS